MKLGRILLFIVGWVSVHYLASHAYVLWCLPRTFSGYSMSLFMIPSPHCSSLRWLINVTGDRVLLVWTSLSVFLNQLGA
jgi:hypothetical protein